MKKITDSLGNEGDFQVGDLVGWTDLSKKRKKLSELSATLGLKEDEEDHRRVGIISEVFSEFAGGRNVVFANVFCLKDEKKYEIPLISLKRIDKNKTIYKKEGKNDGICYN